jgi:hypothetical protein
METGNKDQTRRTWIRPEIESQSTMTTLTQVAPHAPLTLLFLQLSSQCFDSHGNPVPCPPL